MTRGREKGCERLITTMISFLILDAARGCRVSGQSAQPRHQPGGVKRCDNQQISLGSREMSCPRPPMPGGDKTELTHVSCSRTARRETRVHL